MSLPQSEIEYVTDLSNVCVMLDKVRDYAFPKSCERLKDFRSFLV